MKNTIAGVDLAKEVIQVCICTKNKVHSNTDMSHSEFLIWLFKSKSMRIIFEACGTSNYWKQRAIEACPMRFVNFSDKSAGYPGLYY